VTIYKTAYAYVTMLLQCSLAGPDPIPLGWKWSGAWP